MDKIKNIIIISLMAVLTVFVVMQVFGGEPRLGGDTNYDSVDVTDGYKVDGTVVIDGSGNVNAPIESTTGTFSSNVSVTGATVVDEFTQGGGVLAVSTSSATYTLTQAQMSTSNVIAFTPLGDNATLTLPATSTMTTLLASAGDSRTWVIENGATAATTTTIAAGTGMDLQEPDGQNVVIGQNNYAWLTCFRESSTNVVCSVDETIPAD